jgi:hypothetical protein
VAAILNMRTGQRRFMRLTDEYRLVAFLARRQYGKTTTFAKIALKKMMKQRDHTVIFGSAKLNLSREIVRKEAQILQTAITEAIAQAAKGTLQVFDSGTGRQPDALSVDDFAELFEAQRLEFRFYHARGSYSRTKVVALREDTVGETGDLMCDELRAIRNWREVWEAAKPIIASNPDFRCTLSTTIPTSDDHYAFEQLMPPPGLEFTPNPEGNVYESEHGIMVLRVDAWDAFSDGIPLYDDKTGAAQTPDQNRAGEQDKDAWDRNYGCKFLVGGTSACGVIQLATAQERGLETCLHVDVQNDDHLARAHDFLAQHLGSGVVGLGWDLATTEKQTSNPSAFSVVEQQGVNYIARLILTWKTADPETAERYAGRTIDAVARRKGGGRARALHIDATNERYFASTMQRRFRAQVPVVCVVGSESVQRPGYEPMSMKQYLGGLLVGELDDNHLTLPGSVYVKEDFRLVKKERGQFVCTPDAQGRHGDTFDGTKLALNAIKGAPPPALPAAFENTRAARIMRARRERMVLS